MASQFKVPVWDGLQWQNDNVCWVWNGLTWVASTQPWIWDGLQWQPAQSSIITITLDAPTITGTARDTGDPCATVDYTIVAGANNPAGTTYTVSRNVNGGSFSVLASGVSAGARTDSVTKTNSYGYKAIAHHANGGGFIYNDSGFSNQGSVSTYAGAC